MYIGEDVIVGLLSRKGRMDISQLAKEAGLNEDSVRRAVESLKSTGHVTIEAKESMTVAPTEELKSYITGGFPEISVFRKSLSGAKVSDLTPVEKSIGLRWAKVKGLVTIEGGLIQGAKSQEEADDLARDLAVSSAAIRESGKLDDPVMLEELMERRLVIRKTVRQTFVQSTGKPYVAESGFGINVPGPNAPVGRAHPVTRMTKKIKSIMLELGFTEMDGSIAESSFWNFDALFQPQDHPARELADTFYLEGSVPLPDDKKLVERVRKAHEEGWKYKWEPKEAMRHVLRTHTTALSARYVSEIKDKSPRKYFAIGRVFRNEATDYKHLAEFHQVEGIIAWEGAKFTDLLGVLREFYRKLGFEKIRFRPSFFPYTEPSLEIEVYFEERKQWMELGGAGIFRPEVSEPLAGIYPVLAWGLSLERPLMLGLELDDIRTLYRNDLDFLQKSRSDL
jgi:phenylalanyl-tRNA synthetase alpha chain